MTTIELNKIQTLEPLEDLRRLLKEFVNFNPSVMVSVYETDFGWSASDYEADKEQATDLLEQVERRIKSLSHYLARGRNTVPQS